MAQSNELPAIGTITDKADRSTEKPSLTSQWSAQDNKVFLDFQTAVSSDDYDNGFTIVDENPPPSEPSDVPVSTKTDARDNPIQMAATIDIKPLDTTTFTAKDEDNLADMGEAGKAASLKNKIEPGLGKQLRSALEKDRVDVDAVDRDENIAKTAEGLENNKELNDAIAKNLKNVRPEFLSSYQNFLANPSAESLADLIKQLDQGVYKPEVVQKTLADAERYNEDLLDKIAKEEDEDIYREAGIPRPRLREGMKLFLGLNKAGNTPEETAKIAEMVLLLADNQFAKIGDTLDLSKYKYSPDFVKAYESLQKNPTQETVAAFMAQLDKQIFQPEAIKKALDKIQTKK